MSFKFSSSCCKSSFIGFIAWGGIRTEAPEDGVYWIAIRAAEQGATGKYVLAPGVREEFGLDAIGGMADLVEFFNAPWPGETRGGASLLIAVAAVLVAAGVVGMVLLTRVRRRARASSG